MLHTIKKLISNSKQYVNTKEGKLTRKQILQFIIDNDIFGYTNLTVDPNSKVFEFFPNTLIRLLYSSVRRQEGSTENVKVCQYTIALLNAIASQKAGRDYLLPKDDDHDYGEHMTQLLIKRLVQILNKESEDSLLRQYTIGVLQKFSLRNTAQISIINLDVIELVINIIRSEYQTIGDYSLECSMAMLMNLSLRTIGKQKMEEVHTVLVPLLKGILLSGNGQIIIYAIGILFSITNNQTIKEFIQKSNIKDQLAKVRDEIRNSLFMGIQNDDEDEMSEDEKRQLLVQVSFIIQKIEESDTQKAPLKEAEHSRIGFSQSEEPDNETHENIMKENSRPGTTQRNAIDDDEELTDDEELDSTLEEANILIGDALLLAEYVEQDIKDQSLSVSASPIPARSKVEEIKGAGTPKRKDIPVVFDYERPSLKHKKDSDNSLDRDEELQISPKPRKTHKKNSAEEVLRSSNGFEQYKKEEMVRHYQSLNQALLSNDDEYNLVFKTRSKLIQTPPHPQESQKSIKTARASLAVQQNSKLQDIPESKTKPKTKSPIPTNSKKSSKPNFKK